jgi:hypothetical protein
MPLWARGAEGASRGSEVRFAYLIVCGGSAQGQRRTGLLTRIELVPARKLEVVFDLEVYLVKVGVDEVCEGCCRHC